MLEMMPLLRPNVPTDATIASYGISEIDARARVDADFNVFALTDALGERDRKKLWTLYQRAKYAEVSPEEIHGILFWQVKSMLLAKNAKNAEEAGLKPYPFKKSVGFLKHYTGGEVEHLSRKLLSVSHDARRGLHDFDIALERFVLNI